MATHKKTAWTHLHVWYGRVLIFLGIVNGGLGLYLASDTPAYSRAGTIAYSVLAGTSGTVLLALVLYTLADARGEKGEAEGKASGKGVVQGSP